MDFLSTLLTFRLIKEDDKAGLLEENIYKRLMAVLTRARKARIDGESWHLVRINPSQEESLQKIELIPSRKSLRRKSVEDLQGAERSRFRLLILSQ